MQRRRLAPAFVVTLTALAACDKPAKAPHGEHAVKAKHDAKLRQRSVRDPLPAGLAIENPHLAGTVSRGTVWPDEVERVEFRSEAAHFFCRLERGPVKIVYAVRSTTVGSFDWPGAEAASMYSKETASLSE